MIVYDEEDLHQQIGQEEGQGFGVLEQIPDWSDNDVLYQLEIGDEVIGYARVTRERRWSPHRDYNPPNNSEDDLMSELDPTRIGDIGLERANDLEEAPVINNGDQEIVRAGESYLMALEGQELRPVGEAVIVGEGERYQDLQQADLGDIELEEPNSDELGIIRFPI